MLIYGDSVVHQESHFTCYNSAVCVPSPHKEAAVSKFGLLSVEQIFLKNVHA